MKTAVRVAMFYWSEILRPGENENIIGGEIGFVYRELLYTLNIQNYTVKWSDGYFGVANSSGDYDGVIGSLQRNETDIFPMPWFKYMPVGQNPVIFGPPLVSSAGRIMTRLMPIREMDTQVLQSFNTISAAVYAFLFVSFFIFSTLMANIGTNFGRAVDQSRVNLTLAYGWRLLSVLLMKPLINPRHLVEKLLVYSYSIGFLFLTWYFSNLITTDKVSFDTSLIINSLNDILLRKDVNITFSDTEPFATYFSGSSKGHIQELSEKARTWKALAMGGTAESVPKIPDDLRQVMDRFMNGSMAVILSEFFIDAYISALCGYLQNNLPHLQLYRGKESIFTAEMAPYFAKNTFVKMKAEFDMRITRLLETGVSQKLISFLQSLNLDMLPKGTAEGCLIESIDTYIQKKMSGAPEALLALNSVASLFTLVLVIYTAAAMVCFLEIHFASCSSVARSYAAWINSLLIRFQTKIRLRLIKGKEHPSENHVMGNNIQNSSELKTVEIGSRKVVIFRVIDGKVLSQC